MLETPEEIEQLQRLLDRSAAGAGPHMRNIITDERRLTASVRRRQLAVRPATYLPGEELAVTVHGRAELFDMREPSDRARELRQAMLDHYLPLQGPGSQEWLDKDDTIRAARIAADRMFTFGMET